MVMMGEDLLYPVIVTIDGNRVPTPGPVGRVTSRRITVPSDISTGRSAYMVEPVATGARS
jgi:hypothetical protein